MLRTTQPVGSVVIVPRRVCVVVAACLALALGACSSDHTTVDPTTTAPRVIGPVDVGPGATVGPAPADSGDGGDAGVLGFQAPLVGGGTLDASTLIGQPVAFWFWAPT
jgi:hypothetical protein